MIDNWNDLGYRTVMTVAAPGYYGQSGGPILNEDGEVIGLVSGGNMGFHHTQISPTMEALKRFIREFMEE